MPGSRVVVVGSLNIDYIASVDFLPGPGETVSAKRLIQRFGGKGANQALAAARQGARVSMIGSVGNDDHGAAYLRRLAQQGIEARLVSSTSRALTGTALIAVDSKGENIIVVAPGANGLLRPKQIRAHAKVIAAAAIVLVQFEVPAPAIVETLRIANRARVPVVVNPSPWRDDFPWGKFDVDTVIANEIEAESIFRRRIKFCPSAHVQQFQSLLARKRISRIVITRGAQSTVCITSGAYLEVPAFKVRPVDTVGAGDAFAGAFAAARSEGKDVSAAIRIANCAGALATLKPGAQESIPTRAAVNRFLRKSRL